MSPARTPPGDGLSRSRDAVEAISTSTGHKNGREKNEILQLLSLPHIQVCLFYLLKKQFKKIQEKIFIFNIKRFSSFIQVFCYFFRFSCLVKAAIRCRLKVLLFYGNF